MQLMGSFRRLLLDIATFGFLVAVIWSFPEPSLKVALNIGLFLPALATCAFVAYFCKHRMRALLISAGGAFVGWLLSPGIEVIRDLQTSYDWYWDNVLSWGVFPPIGAIIAGVIAWIIESTSGRATD